MENRQLCSPPNKNQNQLLYIFQHNYSYFTDRKVYTLKSGRTTICPQDTLANLGIKFTYFTLRRGKGLSHPEIVSVKGEIRLSPTVSLFCFVLVLIPHSSGNVIWSLNPPPFYW